MDVHSKETRSYNMSMIRGKDTKPEILVRKFLFHNGFRYRKNVKDLPGKPDIVLPKYKTVIFVNGCFWHGHNDCKDSHIPKTNSEWWQQKINRTKERDKLHYEALTSSGWNVIILWDCCIKPKTREETLSNLIISIKKNSSDSDNAK